jgi:hypothetical protein
MRAVKTVKTKASVKEFFDGIADAQKRADAKAVDKLIQKATGEKPKMWGTSIVGYGDTMLTYANGKDVEWMVLGFSPRSTALTFYLPNLDELGPQLKKLGPHKLGKGCLYVKRLADVDVETLGAIVKKGYESASA